MPVARQPATQRQRAGLGPQQRVAVARDQGQRLAPGPGDLTGVVAAVMPIGAPVTCGSVRGELAARLEERMQDQARIAGRGGGGQARELAGEVLQQRRPVEAGVKGRSGELVGAIGISGPDSRLKLIAPQVMEAAEAISAVPGYVRR